MIVCRYLETCFRAFLKLRWLFCFLFLFVCFPVSSVAEVIGVDGRVKLSPKQKQAIPEFRQSGVVNIIGDGGGFASGLVLGRNCDVVITNAHVLNYSQQKMVTAKKSKTIKLRKTKSENIFQFISDPSQPYFNVFGRVLVTGRDRAYSSETKTDWGILRLYKPALSNCHNIRIAYEQTECEGRLFIPASHTDAYDGTYINGKHDQCHTKPSLQPNEIVHNCDVKRASSGAPMFCQDETKQMVLIGINAAGMETIELYDDQGKELGEPWKEEWLENYGVSISGKFAEKLKDELIRSELRAKVYQD